MRSRKPVQTILGSYRLFDSTMGASPLDSDWHIPSRDRLPAVCRRRSVIVQELYDDRT